MRQIKSVAIIYGGIHFLVDFSCAFFMFSMALQIKDFYIGFLLYNFLAFALQMPVGLIADRIKKNGYVAAYGCLLVMGALLCLFVSAGEPVVLWVGLSLVGMGNCLFHVGGGIEVMKSSGCKVAPLGIFVSPGAIGIFLGTMLGRKEALPPLLLAVVLLGAASLLFYYAKEKKKPVHVTCFGEKDEQDVKAQAIEVASVKENAVRSYVMIAGAIACFFLVVVFRSYLGMIADFPWKNTMQAGVFVLAAVFGGKLAGGFVADKMGIMKACVIPLLTATVLFVGSNMIWAGILAMFFFNMSMPLTLYLAAKVLKGQYGFAFGILTFGIFIGFLPAYAGYDFCDRRILMALSAVSLVLLCVGIGCYTKIYRPNKMKGMSGKEEEEVI